MPIRIPDALPATSVLEGENIFVMTEFRALHQDIRPLKVMLLNLMPTKVATETQIMRKLSNTPLQIEVHLLQTASHQAKNTSRAHLEAFYRTFDEVCDEHYDGLIVTGAPVETLRFEDVDYWDELCRIMEWSRSHVHSTFHICWGAQAGIYFHYGIPKHDLPRKVFGVFEHDLVKTTSPLVRGFDERFRAPHSRHTEVRAADIEAHPDLELVAVSEEAGVYLAKSIDSRHFFAFGHPEYDADTLKVEYDRDVALGMNPNLPAHYYPNDDPRSRPLCTWRAHAQLLYTNWLNYYVYQTTPYDVRLAGQRAGNAPGPGPVTQAASASTQGSPERSPYLRAATEDDDGYDPYSDRRDEPPLFEADPWR
ncbi:homoserine O-acetyltransferase MetA [Berryella wangjianweii]